jgi:hypothetical protein
LGFPTGWSFTTHKDCCWGTKKNNLPRQLAITYRACVTKRVRNIGYLLWESLGDGDVEAVSAGIEEGAAVIETILEADEVVVDAVEGV